MRRCDMARAVRGEFSPAALVDREADEMAAMGKAGLDIVEIVADIDDGRARKSSRASSARCSSRRFGPPPSAPCAWSMRLHRPVCSRRSRAASRRLAVAMPMENAAALRSRSRARAPPRRARRNEDAAREPVFHDGEVAAPPGARSRPARGTAEMALENLGDDVLVIADAVAVPVARQAWSSPWSSSKARKNASSSAASGRAARRRHRR